MAQAQAPQVYTAAQLSAMSPAEQQAYFSGLPPDQAAAQQAQLLSYRRSQNASYLAQSLRKIAVCPPVSGGITQAFGAGSSLLYNFPTAAGGFASELIFTLNLTVTLATGTGASYAKNAAWPWNVITEIQVLYNGMQARLRPYFLKVLDVTRRYGSAPAPVGSNTPGGNTQSISAIQNALDEDINAGTVGSGQSLNLVFRLPLNALHALAAEGMLPMQGSGTRPQVNVMCATTFDGADPLLNPILGSGTGHGVTITGTVKCEVAYYDGTNYGGPNPLSLDITGLPTVQYIIDTPLEPLSAGLMQRQRIAALLQHYAVCSIVIDGQQSSAFCHVGNFVNLELDQDSVGQNRFWSFGQMNNVSLNDYWESVRHTFGQDLDEGVILWVAAQAYNQENADNRMGVQFLNMTAGGWTDVHHAYQVTAVSSTNITPRVETFLLSMNPAGLVLV